MDPHAGTQAPRALVVRNLSKAFGRTRALSDVSLELDAGKVHMLLGQNGSGKSTLIKVLSGYYVPDDGGAVQVAGEELKFGLPEYSLALGCRFVHQDLGLVESASVLDNLAFGSGYATRAGTISTGRNREAAQDDLARVGLHVDVRQPVASLSMAQRTAVAVARATRRVEGTAPRLLVLDEPTATLPANEIEHLHATVRAIAADGVAVLYVTHHLDEVYELGQMATVLRDGLVIDTRPTAELAREQLVEFLVGPGVELGSQSYRAARRADTREVALTATGLVAPDLDAVSFVARRGEVLGFAGLSGSGRDAVLGVVFGSEPRFEGNVTVGDKEIRWHRPDLAIGAGVAYVPADRKGRGGVMAHSARENLTLPDTRSFFAGGRMRRQRELAEAEGWFERLSVRPTAAAGQPLSSFSGGNQQKILLAKWLRLNPEILLMDEPTQGVDIGAKDEIHQEVRAVAERGAAVVITSSDEDELAALCDRVLILRRGQIVCELSGDAISESAITHAYMTPDATLMEVAA